MNEAKRIIIESLWRNNSSLVQLLGLCPLLAVSNTATNALGLVLATTLVLVCTNTAVSALRRWIPGEIRIPIYVMIIASVVSTVQMLINACAFGLYQSLDIFIPLIVTNCIVIGQAEAYASSPSDWAQPARYSYSASCMSCSVTARCSMVPINCWARVLRIEVFHTDTPLLLAMLPPSAFIGLEFILAEKYLIDQRMKARQPKPTRPVVLQQRQP